MFLLYFDVLCYFADILRAKRVSHFIQYAKLTDFAAIRAVIFVTKRVSKFIRCSYVVLLYCAILLIFS